MPVVVSIGSTWTKKALNYTLEGEGFFISYLPDSNQLGSSMAGSAKEETAIVTSDGYRILDGDHRAAYEERLSLGLDACVNYYRSHLDQRSVWSDLD